MAISTNGMRKPASPLLLADAAGLRLRAPPGGFIPNDGEWYAEVLANLFNNPGCIGFHLVRSLPAQQGATPRGLLDEFEKPDGENVELISAANRRVSRALDERF